VILPVIKLSRAKHRGERKITSRRFTAWLIPIIFLLSFAPVIAQQSGRVYRIGYLSGGFSGSDLGFTSIRRELRDLGYIEGKNITFEPRYAEERPEGSRALAEELVRLKVDVIVAGGTNDTLAAKNVTTTVPIVFLESVSDPVEQGLVANLARPGGNITGFTTIAWVLAGKRLELLKEVFPKLSRVSILWDPEAPGNPPQWKESQRAAQQLGLQLHSMEVSNSAKYESGFKDAIKSGSTALAVTRHRLSIQYQKRIIQLSAINRLPTIYPRGDFVENGGLMSYGPDVVEPYRRAASMIDRILKGAKPADLPVEAARDFDLAINLETAKKMGFTIPPNMLARADRVFR
jgi:putative tryptophan/tyrosine transport system substrate-binding protein